MATRSSTLSKERAGQVEVGAEPGEQGGEGGQGDDEDRPAQCPPAGGEDRRRAPGRLRAAHRRADHVHVELGAGVAHDVGDDRARHHLVEARAPAGPEDELRGPLGQGGLHEGGGHVGPGDLAVLTPGAAPR
jgi:hypothetical protein